MKKTVLAAWLLLTGLLFGAAETALAQVNTKVVWGPALKDPRKTSTIRIIGNDRTGFFTLRNDYSSVSLFSRENQKYFLERYDLQNKLAFSKELSIPNPVKSKQRPAYEAIYYLDGQLVLFSSYFDKDNDRNVAFANKVNADGTVDPKTVDVSVIEGATSRRKSGGFSFSLSNDSSKILVYQDMPYDRKENEKFQFKVLDKELNILVNKAVTLPQLDKETQLSDYRVDNDGNVYVLASTLKKREERKSKEQKYLCQVYGYFRDSDQVKSYTIQIPSKFVTDITFDLDNQKNLIVAGFYADDKKLKASGTFFMKVDFATKKILTQGVKDFSKEFLEMFMSKTRAKNENAGVANMDLDKLIVREDGGALLVGEQAYEYVVQNKTQYTYHYVRNDIVFININPDGSIEWMKRVPKKQHTVNDGGIYSSYSVSVMKDKIYLIYNDHVKNIGRTDPKKLKFMKKPAKAVTMLAVMDASGEVQKKALFPAKDHKTIVRPGFYLQDSKSVIIYSENGRNYRFGNIEFN
ncbi:hypothetical protein I5M27_14595 [Adhaeribacter sp. BT258]|uniref:S9 family peptidase n=1 Tax=Adhaeribacter terrigena TaxID=2793070 RepID=A0ABS1C4D9_9BACT|nr:hypothetical protein [Adhaeribacter terrigena]MBK0404222.1 hypothetical protein [Adhaeribacter terrigena]